MDKDIITIILWAWFIISIGNSIWIIFIESFAHWLISFQLIIALGLLLEKHYEPNKRDKN